MVAIWGSDERNILGVGQQGKIFHYDGSSWHEMTSPTEKRLHAISGSSAHDIYASGEHGTLLHYDGRVFSPVRTPDQMSQSTISAVGGDGQSTVIAGANQAALLFQFVQPRDVIGSCRQACLEAVFVICSDNTV